MVRTFSFLVAYSYASKKESELQHMLHLMLALITVHGVVLESTENYTNSRSADNYLFIFKENVQKIIIRFSNEIIFGNEFSSARKQRCLCFRHK
jgi:hypothetical protein